MAIVYKPILELRVLNTKTVGNSNKTYKLTRNWD